MSRRTNTSKTGLRRLQKEQCTLKVAAGKKPGEEGYLEGCAAHPVSESDFFNWVGTISGPPDTPYEGGTFNLSLSFAGGYPLRPPKAKFITRVFHPNISRDGGICLDILKNQWSPALTIGSLLQSIRSLLDDPNASDPLDPEAGALYRDNIEAFAAKARQYTLEYAIPK